jgi:hypothetical protein
VGGVGGTYREGGGGDPSSTYDRTCTTAACQIVQENLGLAQQLTTYAETVNRMAQLDTMGKDIRRFLRQFIWALQHLHFGTAQLDFSFAAGDGEPTPHGSSPSSIGTALTLQVIALASRGTS